MQHAKGQDKMFPLIALWCHPRSMSTAMERMMRARGDVTCFHEPFMYHYYLGENRGRFPHFHPDPQMPRTYEDICAMLVETASKGPVFFKDMSYYVVPRVFTDAPLRGRLTNVFLVRDPRRSIASYYKLDPQMSLEEIGLEALFRHADHIARQDGKWPLVLEAEQVQTNPAAAAEALFEAAGLDPAPHALNLDLAGQPEDWERVADWHTDALANDHIRPAETLPDADAVFEQAAEVAPHLRGMLAHHWPFYVKLRERALQWSAP